MLKKIISAEELSVKGKAYYKITMEDASEILVSDDIYFRYHLYPDEQIDGQMIEDIQREYLYSKAHTRAMGWVIARRMTVMQLMRKFATAGIDEEVAGRIRDKFLAEGLIDDADYAQRFTKDATKLQGKSVKAIRYDLMNRGIKKDIINETLEHEIPEGYETEQLYHLLTRRHQGILDESRDVQQKLKEKLMRKGYSYKSIREAWDRLIQERD